MSLTPDLPAEFALFLDFDGTLVDLAATPDVVSVPADLPALLSRLQNRLTGALAMITGRRLADLDGYCDPYRGPAAALHGLERRTAAGQMIRLGDPSLMDEPRRILTRFAAEHPGILVEDKGVTVALHYRLVPSLARECARAAREALAAGGAKLSLLTGKAVFELRPRGINKGIAISHFMTEQPFRDRVPVFIGDDVTDEDGFAAVSGLGGIGIRVGETGETAAQYRLQSPQACRDWLAGIE